MKQTLKKFWVLAACSIWASITPAAFAQPHTSTNYQVNEAFFGTGGDVDASSTNYRAYGSAGALGVGEASSTNYSTFAGIVLPQDEFLEMTVSGSTIDLGTLSPSSTATGNATFSVRAYMNGSYTVITVSNPPTSEGGSQLDPISPAGASATSTEQFGINLKANTSPASFGADPSANPSTTFANGMASTGYDTANVFKYGVGDVIAESGTGRAWGQTDYTISYIANIANLTAAGLYTMRQELVAVPTF